MHFGLHYLVAEQFVALRIKLAFDRAVEGDIVAAPAQRNAGHHFLRRLRVREGVAAEPRSAVVSDNIARLVETRPALVVQSRLDVWRRIEMHDVRRGWQNVHDSAVVLDLPVGDGLQQILDCIDVARIHNIADPDHSVAVVLDGKRLVGIRGRDIAAEGNDVP
ncbi:MAG: hypothetical protein P8X82_04610 [Gemmatimonadales bacterium]